MEEKNYKKLAKMFKEFHGSSTPDTEISVKVDKYGIALYPSENRTSKDVFYHTEEVVDFCRYMKLSNYVYIESNGEIVVRMY